MFSALNYFVRKPFARAFFMQAVIPYLLIERMASVDTLRVTQLSVSGT